MTKRIKLLFFLLSIILYGCGTGPWYVQKNLYQVYKEPIYQNSDLKIRTDGFYAQISDSLNADYDKSIIVFNDKGYCVFLRFNQLQRLIDSKMPIEKELDWWKVKNDSIIIENYGETTRLIKTMIWWHKGEILNDSVIEIAYQDDHYKYDGKKYKFIESKKIPKLKNKTRYFRKEWYKDKLNESRK